MLANVGDAAFGYEVYQEVGMALPEKGAGLAKYQNECRAGNSTVLKLRHPEF